MRGEKKNITTTTTTYREEVREDEYSYNKEERSKEGRGEGVTVRE